MHLAELPFDPSITTAWGSWIGDVSSRWMFVCYRHMDNERNWLKYEYVVRPNLIQTMKEWMMHQRHVGNATLDSDFISWYLQLADNIPE